MKDNETLEEALKNLQEYIDNYKPATKWEAANNRTLKRLCQRRNALEKAIERKQEKRTKKIMKEIKKLVLEELKKKFIASVGLTWNEGRECLCINGKKTDKELIGEFMKLNFPSTEFVYQTIVTEAVTE